jgi:hypothetical protein
MAQRNLDRAAIAARYQGADFRPGARRVRGVLIDNSASLEALRERLTTLWRERVVERVRCDPAGGAARARLAR